MNKPTRTPLAQWQLDDAERLSAIYKKRVKESKDRGDDKVLNQTEVGERCGWNSPQSAFSQYANGKVALNLDALIRLSKALDFQPAEVSPTLADGVAISPDDKPAAPIEANSPEAPITSDSESDSEHDDNFSFIPQYTAKAAAGFGHENPHVESVTTLAFKREWLRAKGLNSKHLIAMSADGDSMWPTINDHDVLLLDTSKTEPADGQVFVLTSADKGTIVKRLIKTPLGGWIIRSDNDDCEDYADVMLARSEVNEHRIIGKVIWRGGDL